MPLPTRPQRYCDPASLVYPNINARLRKFTGSLEVNLAKEIYHPFYFKDFQFKLHTVEPRNNSLALKGSPSIKVSILRSQIVVFIVIHLSLKVILR